MNYLRASIPCVLILCLSGCITESAPDTAGSPDRSAIDVPSYDFNLPPKQLLQKVKQVLSSEGISIASQNKGVIITDYKNYPGTFHIARRWEERTRYRITIYPDFDNPTQQSHLEVTDETQTRATDHEPWHTWVEYQRPQRSAQLAKLLHDRIAS